MQYLIKVGCPTLFRQQFFRNCYTSYEANTLLRIETNSDVNNGKPYIIGSEISVSIILDLLSFGLNFQEIIERYPVLSEADIRAALEFAKISIDRNEDLNEFAYIVSHDLKAPLRGISYLTGWLAKNYKEQFDERGIKRLNLLISRTERMHALIEGILQYSRVGFANQNTSVVNVQELLKSIIGDLNPPEQINIQIEATMPTDFIINKTQLQQIFQNLLDNAIKFIDKSEGHIQIRCEEKDSVYQFKIVDNGPGIEEKDFSLIFKMFQSISSNRENETKKGTGIGLALVKKIVEIHNGKIWIESTPGLSTSFIFTLPKNHAYLEH